MHRKITRRDFLNGVSVGVGGAMVSATGVSKVFGADTLLAAAALDELSPQERAWVLSAGKNGHARES